MATETTIDVYAAVSIGRWNEGGTFSMTVMQRPGGPEDPYGGYREVKCEYIPLEIDPDDLVLEMADGELTLENWEDAKTHWDEDDGGPYEVLQDGEGGIVVREWESR